MDFIYIKENKDWLHENKEKYGYVCGDDDNLINRLHNSREEHSELSKFNSVYAFNKTSRYLLNYNEIDKIISLVASNPEKISIVEKIYETKFPFLRQLEDHLVKSQTKQSNEFIYETGLDILHNVLEKEFPLMGLELYKKYEKNELDVINNASKKRNHDIIQNDFDNLLQILSDSRKRKQSIPQYQKKDEYKWFEREYQRNVIANGYDKLMDVRKLYLELATGAGKSYIMYKIIARIKPESLLILSPRKKINKQNVSEKYLQILGDEYEVFNCSEDTDYQTFKSRCEKNNKKVLIVACPNNDNLYDIISNNEITDIFIWFDEAHHTIENWVSCDIEDRKKQFFLHDETCIKYRVFTSASPDFELVKQNSNVFGELYCEISVKDLIAQKWLCPILPPLILGENIQDFNLLRWITDGFIKNNRRFGFSFHSRDNNAFELFYKHYTSYKDGNIAIKPFLLIHDKGKLNDKNMELMKNIKLDYDFRDDKVYECSPLSIAYVVKQYDMGYDFPELDYICITDKKVSAKDIIQCIGRGTRPDKLGPNGTNRDKDLLIALPTYMDEDNKNEYKNIIEVMRYLIYDLEMDIEAELTNASKPSDGGRDTISENYEGERENTSKMLELLYNADILNRPSNHDAVIKLCVKHNITTEQDYHRLRDNNPAMRLRTTLYDYGGFFWQRVVDPNKIQYYGTKRECIEAREKIMVEKEQDLSEDAYDEFMEDVQYDQWKELNKYDSNIPPYPDIDRYYPPN